MSPVPMTERDTRRDRASALNLHGLLGEAAEQTGQCQRIGDALVGRRQGIEWRLLPGQAPGGPRQRVWQRARAGAERGECHRGGQAGVAEGQIERVHPEESHRRDPTLDLTMSAKIFRRRLKAYSLGVRRRWSC